MLKLSSNPSEYGFHIRFGPLPSQYWGCSTEHWGCSGTPKEILRYTYCDRSGGWLTGSVTASLPRYRDSGAAGWWRSASSQRRCHDRSAAGHHNKGTRRTTERWRRPESEGSKQAIPCCSDTIKQYANDKSDTYWYYTKRSADISLKSTTKH